MATKGDMVPREHDLPQLTPAELDVMKVLWSEGRLSARELHDRVAARHDWAYSTTRTTIERMVRKGLVDKLRFHGLHLYAPAISRARGLARMVRDFAREVLEVNPVPVVSLFADAGNLSQAELDELRELVVGDTTEQP